MKEEKRTTPIHCPNCEYIWIYSGKFESYATCPSCRKNVRIAENSSSYKIESNKLSPRNASRQMT